MIRKYAAPALVLTAALTAIPVLHADVKTDEKGLVTFGGTLGRIVTFFGGKAAKEGVVPILYYHRVENVPAGFATWSKASQDNFLVDDTLPFAFAAQLDWLAAHGYTTILPRDLAINQRLRPDTAKYDARRFNWIGTLSTYAGVMFASKS